MRYLILSVPLSLLVSKETPGPHFVQRLLFLINISLNIMHLVCICICYVSKIIPLVVILKSLCMHICIYITFSRARAHTLSSATFSVYHMTDKISFPLYI